MYRSPPTVLSFALSESFTNVKSLPISIQFFSIEAETRIWFSITFLYPIFHFALLSTFFWDLGCQGKMLFLLHIEEIYPSAILVFSFPPWHCVTWKLTFWSKSTKYHSLRKSCLLNCYHKQETDHWYTL